MKNAKGFTIVEILFALFIGVLLLSAVYGVMTAGHKSAAGIERKVAAQQDVRAALEIMGLEIGMASYNPAFASGLWLVGPTDPNNCKLVAGNQAYKGIQEATPVSLTIEMDLSENGTINNNDTPMIQAIQEIVRYVYYMGDQQYISRSTNCEPESAFLGDTPTSGNPRAVRVINDGLGIQNGNGATAIFRYYDGQNPPNELFPTGANVDDIRRIRRIDIMIAVETDESDPYTKQRKQMTYSTSVIPRNHAFSY